MPGPFKDAFFGLCSTLYVGDCYGSILNLLHGLHISLGISFTQPFTSVHVFQSLKAYVQVGSSFWV